MCPAQAARSPALPAVLALSLSVTAVVHSARALHDFVLRRGVHCLNRPLGAELSAAHVPSGERRETRPGRASTGHRVQGERVGRIPRGQTIILSNLPQHWACCKYSAVTYGKKGLGRAEGKQARRQQGDGVSLLGHRLIALIFLI